MREVREYQVQIENAIPRALQEHHAVIVQSPTGSGKSHIINQTVKRIMRRGKTALVLSDSKKIHSQLLTECNAHPIISRTKWLKILSGECYVAMTQSLANRSEILEQFRALGTDLVLIIDECHRNTMTKMVDHIAPKWLLGFSATPHWRWAKHLPRLYQALIHGPQIGALIPRYLAHYSHLIRTGVNLTELKIRRGEFTEESQDAAFGTKSVLYNGLFEDLPNTPYRKCVIYVASIKLCEQLYEELRAAGYNVTRYHSLLDESNLALFTHGSCTICVSVSALTLGWDHPPIDLIVLWRATNSLPLYLQMCGRGARPLPGKSGFTVLDYGGNFERFGAWDMPRDWNSLWREVKRRTTSTYAGVAGSKECPVCHMLLPVAARSCDNCGYIYPEREMQLVEGKLVQVADTLARLDGRRVGDLTPEELSTWAKLMDRRAHAVRVARAMEQRQHGFLEKFAACMGYRRGWVEHQLERLIAADALEFNNLKIKIPAA